MGFEEGRKELLDHGCNVGGRLQLCHFGAAIIFYKSSNYDLAPMIDRLQVGVSARLIFSWIWPAQDAP